MSHKPLRKWVIAENRFIVIVSSTTEKEKWPFEKLPGKNSD